MDRCIGEVAVYKNKEHWDLMLMLMTNGLKKPKVSPLTNVNNDLWNQLMDRTSRSTQVYGRSAFKVVQNF